MRCGESGSGGCSVQSLDFNGDPVAVGNYLRRDVAAASSQLQSVLQRYLIQKGLVQE